MWLKPFLSKWDALHHHYHNHDHYHFHYIIIIVKNNIVVIIITIFITVIILIITIFIIISEVCAAQALSVEVGCTSPLCAWVRAKPRRRVPHNG